MFASIFMQCRFSESQWEVLFLLSLGYKFKFKSVAALESRVKPSAQPSLFVQLFFSLCKDASSIRVRSWRVVEGALQRPLGISPISGDRGSETLLSSQEAAGCIREVGVQRVEMSGWRTPAPQRQGTRCSGGQRLCATG